MVFVSQLYGNIKRVYLYGSKERESKILHGAGLLGPIILILVLFKDLGFNWTLTL